MRILMLGSKECPLGSGRGFDPVPGGGIERHVDRLSHHLAIRGHNIHVLTRRFPGQAGREDKGNIHIHRVPYLGGRLMRSLSYNILGFSLALRLSRRADLIHCHGSMAGFFGVLLSLIAGRPMVFTPHGMVLHYSPLTRPALRLLERLSLIRASRVIFISEPASRALSRLTRKPWVLLSNGIDPEEYDFELPTHPGEIRFLFLGRLEKVKGADIVMEAFRLIRDSCPNARLLIAGEGPERSRLEALRGPGISFLGWADSREALRNAEVFVLPSREKGQPVALLEAMSAGRIIITSLPFIRDRYTGLLCKPEPHDLAERMRMVCRDFRDFRALGSNARKASMEFSWKSQILLFEKEYLKAT
jgi:glycosyltransferase involved in cell wall biosynthesis